MITDRAADRRFINCGLELGLSLRGALQTTHNYVGNDSEETGFLYRSGQELQWLQFLQWYEGAKHHIRVQKHNYVLISSNQWNSVRNWGKERFRIIPYKKVSRNFETYRQTQI